MKYLELSIEKSIEESKKMFDKINELYDFDLVIFIAKGSFIIGKTVADLKGVPLLEIFATRKGNILKKIISPLLKYIPKTVLIKMREKEVKSDYHTVKNDRKIDYDKEKYQQFLEKKRILLVDDSIDSGNSIILTSNAIKNIFPKSELKIATMNVMKKSSIRPDYYLYEDTMICGPWSNDSKEHSKYIRTYKDWKERNEE